MLKTKEKAVTVKRFVTVSTILFIVFAITFFPDVTLAWFARKPDVTPNAQSSIKGSFFESGTGTEPTPYEIARPIQLYYLAWLQDLGYFDDLNQQHFYISADLDMNGIVLPPIGTDLLCRNGAAARSAPSLRRRNAGTAVRDDCKAIMGATFIRSIPCAYRERENPKNPA